MEILVFLFLHTSKRCHCLELVIHRYFELTCQSFLSPWLPFHCIHVTARETLALVFGDPQLLSRNVCVLFCVFPDMIQSVSCLEMLPAFLLIPSCKAWRRSLSVISLFDRIGYHLAFFFITRSPVHCLLRHTATCHLAFWKIVLITCLVPLNVRAEPSYEDSTLGVHHLILQLPKWLSLDRQL